MEVNLLMMKIVRCSGEGASACKRCTDNGKWNITWTCFYIKLKDMKAAIALIA